MKKLALAGSALLVVAALSCTRELDIETPVSQEYIFEAVWADGSGTRTALQEDGTSVWWTTGEEINVFYGSIASGKFVSTNTEPAALTSFSGSLPVVTGTVEGGHSAPAFWGVYPYDAANTCDGESVTLTVPARQPATDGTFADKFFPAVAVSQDFALAFYNVCGGARFSVANTGIYAVTFEAVGGENLVGKVKVGFGSDGKPVVRQVSEGSAEVTVNAPAGGFVPGKYYFAAFLPGTLSQGLKVTYRTATQSASITQSNSLTINRSRFGTIDRKDEGLTFVDGGGASGYAMPEAIDLGLSVKWASFNLGATKPEEYGNYYAWGETEPKEDYSWSTYKWCMGSSNTLTKYCLDPDYGYNGYSDDNTILDPEDDAATVNLGGNWRMPTMSEWHELISNCTWTKTTQNGKVGYLGISKITGYTNQSIFLPAAGGYEGTTYYSPSDEHSTGAYFSSLLNPEDPYNAFGLVFQFYSEYESFDGEFDEEVYDELTRYMGLSVRPVYGSGAPVVQVESVSLDKSEITMVVGDTEALTATIQPALAIERTVSWKSSNSRVAEVDWYTGLVTAVGPGSAVITARTLDGGKTASCEVLVWAGYTTMPVPEAVDLGLPSGVKWASFNVGAGRPEEFGNYYAWGETEPYYSSLSPMTWKPGKEAGYGWSTYKWSMGSYDQLTKYSDDPSIGYNGFVDNKAILDPEDDVAHVKLEGKWRMPTPEEFRELKEYCTWTQTTQNGVAGYRVDGLLGSIFLPAAGAIYYQSVDYVGEAWDYWSSSVFTNEGQSYYAIGLSDDISPNTYSVSSRTAGKSIRAVFGDSVSSVESVSLDKKTLSLSVGGIAELHATILPSSDTYRSVEWSSSNPSVAAVTSEGMVAGLAKGTATITVRTVFGEKTATCTVTVSDNVATIPVPTAVDLGLSVKWASFNIGASKPEEYGFHYAWGETEPKARYNWSNYKWSTGDYNTLTKYCYDSEFGYQGFRDNKMKLDPSNDVARVKLGGKWRMPTAAEQEELCLNCTYEWTTRNGVNGFTITGPNHNSIFLPAAGVGRWGDFPFDGIGLISGYWSSDLSEEYTYTAWSIYMQGNDPSSWQLWFGLDTEEYNGRDVGFSVRAVSD